MSDDDEDDLLPELPSASLDDDELPGDDDLGLVREIDLPPDQPVGLDDSAGMDGEAIYALDLPPEDDVSDEEVDAIPVEGLDGDDEHGWTDDPRVKEEEAPWDPAELDLPGLSPLSSDDGGEEGVDDMVQLGGGGDEAPDLPLLAGGDDDIDDLTLADDVVVRTFDDGESSFAPLLEPPACRVEALGGGPITCLAPGLAGGPKGLFAVKDERLGAERLSTERLSTIDALSVAVDPEDPRRVVVGTPSGALRSEDGGRTFTDTNEWARERGEAPGAFAVRWESSARLWGASAAGALFLSEDGGLSWSGPLLLKPVAALVVEGGVVALCASRKVPPQLARSEDGGQRWTAVDGPPSVEVPCSLAVLRDAVAVASSAGTFLSRDRGKSWARVPGLPPARLVALADEPGGLTVYTAHSLEGRAVVARHRPGGGEPALVLDLEADEVSALDASASGGLTVLHVATSAGLLRVRVDPDRAP